MDFTDRFFGKGTPRLGGPPVANPRLADPPVFRVLFPAPPDLDADALTLALRGYGEELAAATAEVERVSAPSPGGPVLMGLIGWGRHVVKLVGYDTPLPPEDVEQCVLPAFYEPEVKEAAYRHGGHVQLFYAGYEADVLERHVALAAASAALARFGAVAVLNEAAHTSVPATDLLPHEEDGGDTVGALRKFPLPYLYTGFVKMEVEDEPGVWMRTHGNHAFGLPDLAFRADGHHRTGPTVGLFRGVTAHLRETGRTLAAGDVLGLGDGLFFRTRAPSEEEWFLGNPGPLLVAEAIPEAEANT